MKVITARLLFVVALCISWVGCASIGPPEPPSLELPKPPTDLHAVRKGDKVTLTWSIPARTTYHQTVRYLGKTLVCRGIDPVLSECGSPVGAADPPADVAASLKAAEGKKIAASYVDGLTSLRGNANAANPFATVTYAVEANNEDGRSAGLSNQIHVSLAATLPPPSDFSAQLTGQGVALSWTGQPPLIRDPHVRYAYQVFRRGEGKEPPVLVGEIAAEGHGLSVTDRSMEWEKTYYYHADTVIVLSETGKADVSVEGDDSAEVRIFAHDVFPPAVPSGLQAVFSGPGQQAFVDLVWSPVTDADLAGYNVYRHEAGVAAVKVNAELVPTPSYRDLDVAAGKSYFYSVSAVDQRGNESAKSEEASETVP